MPDWTIQVEPMRGRLLGWIDRPTQVIHVREGITQAQRRVVLCHEHEHILRGHDGHCRPTIELDIDKTVACYLIPLPSLVDAFRWSWHVTEIAEHLWVTRRCVLTRFKYLTDDEAAEIRAALGDVEKTA